MISEIPKLLESILPADRIKSRLIDLVAYAPDAGFYALQPKAVVQVISTDEVKQLFEFSKKNHIPITFRAAGTSLSGQSISDGILVDLSLFWNMVRVELAGDQVRVKPGVIGAVVNAELKKFGRKIGPDPASINSAMMGGILANNASGMCCGVQKNSYHTLKYIHFVLPNGNSYNTENNSDYERFLASEKDLATCIIDIRQQILAQESLKDKIRHKYQTKNTVGYAMNAFVDYEHPLDIMAHTLIGSEGTLGFIAEAVLDTVPDLPFKSTSMLYFKDIFAACHAIVPLRDAGAEAIELMDRASLRSVEDLKGIPSFIKELSNTAAALLVEFQAQTLAELEDKLRAYRLIESQIDLLRPTNFTENALEQAFLWKIRKGMFPSVGSVRASGTTVILEDIAFPVAQLGNAILDLQELFSKYNYTNAIIFGHAKDGNIHFVVTQSFDTPAEIARYDAFIQEVVVLVVQKYKGALKAEHGTGRNMAPFVETEWGPEIYQLMKRLKAVVDPHLLLNPGVIINPHKDGHLRNLKDLPQVEIEVDRCMECGFCEHKCPSRDITLTPRQRIVVRRELKRLRAQGNEVAYQDMLQDYQYDGLETCAVDGLCATACPVDINTGALVKRLRKENHSPIANKIAVWTSHNFGLVANSVKFLLKVGQLINRVFGKNSMLHLTQAFRKVIPAFPLWSNQLNISSSTTDGLKLANVGEFQVIYYPSCISRVMGGSQAGKPDTMTIFKQVAEKAGIGFRLPQSINQSCCGQIYSSKGFSPAYQERVNQTVADLYIDTEGGKLPVVIDFTSCTHTLRDCRPALSVENQAKFDALNLLDTIEFAADYLVPRLNPTKKLEKVVLHPVCSAQKMGIDIKFMKVAKHFAEHVEVPFAAGCCGMAGDRGFLVPELTASATFKEASEVKRANYDGYYSTAKTCEMAMSEAVGKNYESILYLIAETSN
ncbi:MAG: FAD-binding oxidoreductase [Pedobacter sp.]|nr:MAG: FAD-binding oxidoreductase [Pedobacter sp.]